VRLFFLPRGGPSSLKRYRPSTLDDLIAHEEIISILTRLIASGKLPHLLFYGPPGTGKVRHAYPPTPRRRSKKALESFLLLVCVLNASPLTLPPTLSAPWPRHF
jgi:hypothetical protein